MMETKNARRQTKKRWRYLSLALLLTPFILPSSPWAQFARNDCDSVAAGQRTLGTDCRQITTIGGRTAGRIYRWNGSAWVDDSQVTTQVKGAPTTAQATVNHIDSTTIDVDNPSAGQVRHSIKTGSVLKSHIENVAESKLLGRGQGAGAGAPQEITLGTGLSMSGSTLSSTAGGGAGDAADLTYTPAVLGDWNSSVDPGNADGALDQLASRTKTLEGFPIPADSIGPTEIDETANYAFTGTNTHLAGGNTTFRDLVDQTKQMQFDLTGISTATTHSLRCAGAACKRR